MHAGREYVARAMQGGADAYLLKDSAVQDLVAAIHAVIGGGTLLQPVHPAADGRAAARRRPRPAGCKALTEREREVLALVARGLSSKEIAAVARHRRADGRDAPRQPDAQAGREIGGAADSGGDPRRHRLDPALDSVARTEQRVRTRSELPGSVRATMLCLAASRCSAALPTSGLCPHQPIASRRRALEALRRVLAQPPHVRPAGAWRHRGARRCGAPARVADRRRHRVVRAGHLQPHRGLLARARGLATTRP